MTKSKLRAIAVWIGWFVKWSALLALSPLLPWAATAEQVKTYEIDAITSQAEQEQRKRRLRLKVGQNDDLLQWIHKIKSEQPTPAPEVQPPVAKAAPKKVAPEVIHPAQPPSASEVNRPIRSPKKSVSRSSRSTKSNKPNSKPKDFQRPYQVASVSFSQQEGQYGISFDQWMKAELRHPLTSQDRIPVKLYLIETVSGRRQNLPSGSVFVGSHTFDTRTGKLFITLNNVHQPGVGKTSMRGSVYDLDKNYGLIGTVISDIKQRFAHSRSAIGQTVLGNVLHQAVPNDQIVGQSIKAGVKSFNNTRQPTPTPGSYLRVEPQQVLINVEATF